MSEGGPPRLVLTVVTQNKCELSEIWLESREQKVLSSGAARVQGRWFREWLPPLERWGLEGRERGMGWEGKQRSG